MGGYAAQLRQELSQRNSAYASSRGLAHVCSYGEIPAVVYEPCSDGRRHGNFLDASYRAILKDREWKKRLDKVHAQARQALPRRERAWKELDSCMSSDALLMNIFCHPHTLSRRVCCSLGVEIGERPHFGFRGRVPLCGGRTDRTEIDMKLGSLLVEAKLTESLFESKAFAIVDCYRDLDEVFERRHLPQARGQYSSYQLIRNVLAAHALNVSFCVLLDSRRPDLIESWYTVMSCIRIPGLRTRCKVLTWQELSSVLPSELGHFLKSKYGIAIC